MNQSVGFICPKCRTANSEVVDTRPRLGGKQLRRRRWCLNPECQVRWNTVELVEKEPVFTYTHKREDRTNTSHGPPPTRAIDTSHTSNGQRQHKQSAFSRSISGSDPISSSGPISNPDLSNLPDQMVDPASACVSKKRRATGPIQYPAAFSSFWDNIGSTRTKGLKSEALWNWNAQGRPAAELLVEKWNEYLRSLGDTFPKDVCRWLARRGWEEEYGPPPLRRMNGHQNAVDRKAEEQRQMFEQGRVWAAGGKTT